MNFSKLTDDVIMLFDKPVIDSPLFTTNVPDNILSLMTAVMNDDKFRLRTTYMKYILDEDNHMVFLVIRRSDNEEDYPARFLSDKVYLNGEKYGIIIIPESYYYTSRDEKIINMLNICARACYLVLGMTTLATAAIIDGVDLVEFFAPMVMGLTIIGCKFALYDEDIFKITHDTLNNIYGIKLEKDWLDLIAADINDYGIGALLDNNIIYSETSIYISALAKYSVNKKEEQNASV